MWRISRYEQIGRSHAGSGKPCQDKTAARSNGTVWAMALADGAGSAARAEDGAACICECMTAYLVDNFDDIVGNPDGAEVKKQLLAVLHRALAILADETDCRLKDLACTLLAAAVKDDTYFLVHIGDGLIGYLKEDTVRIASAPVNGEYANQTTFVTSPEALSVMNLLKGKLGSIEGFVLMSDGTAASFYEKRLHRLVPALKSVFDWNAAFTEETVQDNLRSTFAHSVIKNTGDDCSIAVLSRPAAYAPSGKLPEPGELVLLPYHPGDEA